MNGNSEQPPTCIKAGYSRSFRAITPPPSVIRIRVSYNNSYFSFLKLSFVDLSRGFMIIRFSIRARARARVCHDVEDATGVLPPSLSPRIPTFSSDITAFSPYPTILRSHGRVLKIKGTSSRMPERESNSTVHTEDFETIASRCVTAGR